MSFIRTDAAAGAFVAFFAFFAALAACSSSSSSSGSSSGTSGGSSGDVPPPPYPAGPYGIVVGSTFPNVTWVGERGGGGTTTSIASGDYFDPAGTRGIRGVLFTIQGVGCGGAMGPCNSSAHATEAAIAGPPYDFAKRGGRAVDLLTQVWSGGTPTAPATVDDLATWIGANGITYDVVVDPAVGSAVDGGLPSTSIGPFAGVPTMILVDARTMKVTQVLVGEDDSGAFYHAMDGLLVQNGAPEVALPPLVDASTD